MKYFCIVVLFAVVMFGTSLSFAATSSPSYKIIIRQVNPEGRERHVICKRSAARCHVVLPLKSKTGVGAVDVNVQFEGDEPCLTFKFGVTALQSDVGCIKNPSVQKASLYLSGEDEHRRELHQDLVLRTHFHTVAEIVVGVGPATARHQTF